MSILLMFLASAATTVSVVQQEPIEERVITASRLPVPLERAPVMVDRIDAAPIEARGSPLLTDMLRGLPGLTISESGPPGSLAEVRVRGAESNHVLVLVNGIEMNDPASGSVVDFSQLDPAGTRMIEVLRGPQSALWGSDALAGVIALDTRPPPDTRSRLFSASSGSLDTVAATLDVADATRPLYYAATLSSIESGGVNVATVGGEDDGFRRRHGQLDAGYRGKRWSIDTFASLADSSSEFDPTPFPAFVPRDGDMETDTTRRLFGLSIEGDAGRWHHGVRVWRAEIENETFEDRARTNAASADKTHLEYQLDRSLVWGEMEHRVSGAIERETEGYQGEGPITPFGDPNQHQTITSSSLVGEWTATFGAFDLSLSARADENDEFEDARTARMAARYTLDETDTVLFVLAGTGVKNPTFTERYGFTPDTFIGNPELEPEKNRSVSIGVEQSLDAVWLRAAWFRDRLEDEIDGFVFDPAAGGFTSANRDGTSLREGIELSATVPLVSFGTLRCDYTYLDATERTEGRDVDEIRRPRHAGGCVIDFAAGDGLDVQLGSLYTGERSDSDFGTFPARTVTLDGYWLAAATLRYRMLDWLTLTGRIDNAFDDRHMDVFGYDSAGRRFTVGFEARLD